MVEVLNGLLRANLIGSLAILAVLAVRLLVRRRFGPEVAYRLWAMPPLASAATLLPLKTFKGAAVIHPLANLVPGEFAPWLFAAWTAGFFVVAVAMCRAQVAFLRATRRGAAGPAVVGVITPRLIMPPDDGRYTAEERALIRAHEREHIQRQDPRDGALMVVLQCLAWFNPLVHLAAHLARLDQELACDAAVLRRHPKARALYAKTLLKTQLAGAALPLGCYWTARGRHPLEVRVAQLARPSDDASLAGPILIITTAILAAALAWAAEPPLPLKTRPPLVAADPYVPYGSGHMSVLLVTWRAAPNRR
jgi:beta-lactamase regulating signal transducer with metallopeptidase domain